MDGFTIYHNPRWGKSRQTLQLLRDNSIEPIIINYLIDIPSQNEIKSLAKKLGKRPAEFVRKGEKDFKENRHITYVNVITEPVHEKYLLWIMIEFQLIPS